MTHRPSPAQPPGRDPARRAWFIFLVFFLMGAAGTAYYARQGIRNYRVFHVYQPAQCSVTSFRMLTNTFSAGLGRSGIAKTTYTPEYAFRHVLNGKTYAAVGYDNLDGRMGQEESFDVGSNYPCWYDPADPAVVVLVRHFHPIYYAIAVVPLLFLLIGGNFLWLALGPKAKIKIADGGQGDVLAVRLAPDMSQGTALASMVVILVVWSAGLLGALAWIVSEDGGSIDVWGFFLLLGIGAEYWLVRFVASAARAIRIPDPIVEIDHEPLARGDKMKVSVRQQGPAHFDIFRIAVACERREPRGTTKENQQVLLLRKSLDVAEGAAFQNTLDAGVPADAPVSDKTLQSFTTWKVVVKRTKKGFLALDREYVFRVI